MSNWYKTYLEVTKPDRDKQMKYFTYGAITGIVLAISVIVIARLLMW